MRILKCFSLVLVILIVQSGAFAIADSANQWVGIWELTYRADGWNSNAGTHPQIQVYANGEVRWLPKGDRMENVKITPNTLAFHKPVGRGWLDITLQRSGDTCRGRCIPVRAPGPKGTYTGKRRNGANPMPQTDRAIHRIGTVQAIVGDDNILLRNGKPHKLSVMFSLLPGDTIKTGKGCRLHIALVKFSGTLEIGERTELSISRFWEKYIKEMEAAGRTGQPEKTHSLFRLVRGWVKVLTGKIFGPGIRFIGTRLSVVGIRGTEFIVHADPRTGTDTWFVLEGAVAVYSRRGERLLESGRQLTVKENGNFAGSRSIEYSTIERAGFGDSRAPHKPRKPPKPSQDENAHAWLGVMAQNITSKYKKVFGLSSRKGALIKEVTGGGPADRAGIRPGDVIITFDGKKVNDQYGLGKIIVSTPPWKNVTVRHISNQSIKNVRVKLGRTDMK